VATNEDIRRLVRDLRKLPGVMVERAGSGHWSVRKDGRLVTTIAATPSDRRAWANIQAELRRAGIDPTTPKRRAPRRLVTPEHVAAAKNRAAADSPETAAEGVEVDLPAAPPATGVSVARAAADPMPYEEETEVSLTVERTGSGWLYTRTRMLVRIERWREPLELTVGDPRKKVPSGSTGAAAPESPSAGTRPTTGTALATASSPTAGDKTQPNESAPAGDKPMAASPRDRAKAVHAATDEASGTKGEARTQRGPESGSPVAPTATSANQGTAPEEQVAPPAAHPPAASSGERRRRVAPQPRPIPGAIRTSAMPAHPTPPRSWIQGGELPPRNAAEWRKAIPYGTETPVWPTTREPDEVDAHILLFIEEEAPVPLRDVALQVGRQLEYSPEAIYPRVYRLARERRVALADDQATQRKVVGVIAQEPRDG